MTLQRICKGCDQLDISESRWCCPICNQWDKAKNMVPATLSGQTSTWHGKAHLKCIHRYNGTHEPKYSIRVYDEKNNVKFIGKANPI